jgi:hypothetical protein
MNAPVAAMMLQCFFASPAGAGGDIPVTKVALPAHYAESMAALDPPHNNTVFAGESNPRKEWIIGNSPDPSAATMKLLRVRLTERLLGSPFDASFGAATKQADGSYTFDVELTGYCELKPAEAPSGTTK